MCHLECIPKIFIIQIESSDDPTNSRTTAVITKGLLAKL